MHTMAIQAPGGHSLSVTSAGEGPPLILLHGFPMDHRQWRPQLESLSATFQVISLDFRGFGGSTLNGDYSLSALADDVELVRTHLAPTRRIILCGLSMGGYVAFEYWRRHAAHVARLVLAHTKPDADTDEARRGREAMIEVARERGGWTAVSPMMEKLISAEHAAEGSPVRERVEAMLRGARAEAVIAAQRAMAARRESVSLLPGIDVPTLVIAGEQDAIAPPGATRKWGAIPPRARTEVIPNVAHLSPLEAPETFHQMVAEFAS